jgi:archaemetzincin
MTGRAAIALFLILTLAGCHSYPGSSLRTKGIAIQPVAFDDTARLAFVQRAAGEFYHCPVYILPAVEMPRSFINLSKGERYSADSILRWLSRRKSDSTGIVLGLTGKDIYVADKDEHGRIKEPESKYAVWGILGLGYQPGDACVISDARFRNTDNSKYDHRLRAIVIHEVGHNIGLPHCKTPHCIMNDANEHISTIDSGENDLCESCRNKLAQLLK